MNGPERAVAIILGAGDHAKAVDVRQPREPHLLFLHLAPDRIRLLGTAKDIGLDARLVQFVPHVAGDPLDHIAGLALQGDEPADDAGARLGVEHAKGQILEFFAHPLHTHAPRQRPIDIHGFTRLLRLLFRAHRLDGAHIVKPVGKLDQNDPQILGHRHEQLAEILGLLGLGIRELQIGKLGDAIHQIGHFAAKFLGNDLIGRLRVLDRIVQEGGDDGGIVQPLLGQDRGHGNRMGEIGLA